MAWMHVQQRLMMRLRYSLLVLLLVWSASILLYMHPNLQTHIGVGKTGAQPGPSKRGVLVMYILAGSDPHFMENFKFFLKDAILEDMVADYAVLVQAPVDTATLPSLPNHAKYVHQSGPCYDMGSYGWLLSSGHLQYRQYKYFFFLNSSVRGPYLPAYARGRIHWTQPFTERLRGDIKLVGPTISCEGVPLHGDAATGPWRRNPHVEAYAFATDQAGLALLRRDPKVFACHTSPWDAMFHGELGASAAVLSAGFNLDSLMARYQGVDWRQQSNWECNGRHSPHGENAYDGISLDPLEVMFIKVRSYTVDADLSSARKALKYADWLQRKPTDWSALAANQYLDETARFKVPKILEAKARGSKCFDFDHYLGHNTDLAKSLTGASAAEVWHHWVHFGQFESRPYRLMPGCSNSLQLSSLLAGASG